MGVGKGNRQTRCAFHSPLPRPVASVKFSANKKREGDGRESRGVRERGTTTMTVAGRRLDASVDPHIVAETTL